MWEGGWTVAACHAGKEIFGQVSDGSEWRFLGMMDAAGNGQPRRAERRGAARDGGDDPAEYHELHAVEIVPRPQGGGAHP